MKKVVYIIPGSEENTRLKKYQEVIKFFQTSHFKTIPIKITWAHRTMSDYTKEFLNQYKPASKNEKVYLFGFSFGAMIAFITANKIKPDVMLLCSLSPYFKEDLPFIKNRWKKSIGTNRLKDFSATSFNSLVKQIRCKTLIFVGTNEFPRIMTRAKETNKKIKNSKLFIVEGAKHELGHKNYLNKLKEVISKL